MHAKTTQWISELEFVKTEQHFLEQLIEENTLYLLSGDTFSKNKELVTHLSNTEKKVNILLHKIHGHNNDLKILVKNLKTKKCKTI